MSSYGKWIGGGLGWAFGGPIGALMGFVFGSIFDSMNTGAYAYKETQPGDFSASLIVLSAAIMKADGKIMRSELNYVKSFFVHNFGAENAKKMMLYLREVQKQNINIDEVCRQIAHHMDAPSKLQLLHYLFGIAKADSHVDKSEEKLLARISFLLGIADNDYNSIKAMFIDIDDQAYKILEVHKNASNDEIKKAYRRMALKYHPDKVSHLGEDFQKAAKEKFQNVNAAYDRIRKERQF